MAAKNAEPAAAPADETQAGPVDPSARVLKRFRVVFNAVKTHFQQVEKRAGIGGAQLWALSVVREQPGIGVNALARAMDVHQTTASNLVRALVAQQMLSARKEGADRRTVQLRVLPAGTRVLRKSPGPFHGVLPEALARLDSRVLARLDKDLAALIKALAVEPPARARRSG